MYYALSIATVAGINVICVSGLTLLTGFRAKRLFGSGGVGPGLCYEDRNDYP